MRFIDNSKLLNSNYFQYDFYCFHVFPISIRKCQRQLYLTALKSDVKDGMFCIVINFAVDSNWRL